MSMKVDPQVPKIVLAPLKGVTDAVFRNTFGAHFSGVDWAITPFLSTSTGPRIKPSHLKEVLPENNSAMPIVPQIMSKSADKFLQLATALIDLGYDTLNWNLGCPYPMVAKKGRGSGLLPHPDAIECFLDRVLAVLPHRLSIKLRLGRQYCHEIDALMPVLNRMPLKEIILHPRTGKQMYRGRPDLKAFERCLRSCVHPVIYNGDIAAYQDYRMLRERFPEVSAWMVGRGAVCDPYLPACIKGAGEPASNAVVRFQCFHEQLYHRYAEKLYGPSHLLNRMKGLWGYFARAFQGGQTLRKRIHKCQKLQHYEDTVNHFFEQDPQWLGGQPKLFHEKGASRLRVDSCSQK